jgi:Bacteriophage lambda head decoration protein D
MVKEPTRQDTRREHEAEQHAAEQHATEAHEHRQEVGNRAEAVFQAEQKRREEEHKAAQKRRMEVFKYEDAREKEELRRAALSAEERNAEDAKRAKMTAEERRKDDESKGLVLQPELQDGEINLLAGQPSYPIMSEPHHPAEFILSEAAGQRSRENAYLADPVTVVVGQPLKQTVAPTATAFGTYIPAAAGADCHALALYSGGSLPGSGLKISILARDAEVNGNLIVWGAITAPEQAIALTTLASKGIIVRY